MATTAQADTFVLVHGAFQDASGWAATAARLEAAGHTVVAVDLPGRNATGAAAQAVSLADHAAAVRAAVEAAGEAVVLVGHSFGGMTVAAVADAVPERVATAVFVAAYLPLDGESMQGLATGDHDNGFTAETFVVAPDYASATILSADQARVFLNDGTPEQQAALPATMLAEPLGPIGTPVTLGAGFAGVAKAYIRTARDMTVSLALQDMMIARAGVTEIETLDTGHLPYVTDPEGLAAALLRIAE
jgi:pimeloyl-ACP methyl ester carboxylesterase